MPRQPSHPLIDHRDEPRVISQADFDAHLEAHRILEERLFEYAREGAAHSDPIELTKTSNGWTVQGKGWYLIALGALVVVGELAWLLLK